MGQIKHTSSSDKTVYWIIVSLTIIGLLFIIFVAFGESRSAKGEGQVVTYQSTDQERPKTVVSGEIKDLGIMKVSDERVAQFTIKNTGTKPLSVFRITSSCDCTFGKITINGTTSQEFNMHSKSKWTGTVDPEQEALVEVIYRPSIMPVKGEITRAVYVSTNDPDKSQLTFTVKAVVE